MRIGKCKKCKVGELVASAICNDNIIETKCRSCGDIIDLGNNPIIPAKKRKVIEDFNKAING